MEIPRAECDIDPVIESFDESRQHGDFVLAIGIHLQNAGVASALCVVVARVQCCAVAEVVRVADDDGPGGTRFFGRIIGTAVVDDCDRQGGIELEDFADDAPNSTAFAEGRDDHKRAMWGGRGRHEGRSGLRQ